MLSDPYTLIAILFFAVIALLIALCFVFERLCALEEKTMRLTRIEARREALGELGESSLCFVDDDGNEVPVGRSL